MHRYIVSKFDANTFIVIDQNEKKEICICSNYDEQVDAEERANFITKLLNENMYSKLIHKFPNIKHHSN